MGGEDVPGQEADERAVARVQCVASAEPIWSATFLSGFDRVDGGEPPTVTSRAAIPGISATPICQLKPIGVSGFHAGGRGGGEAVINRRAGRRRPAAAGKKPETRGRIVSDRR